MANLDVFLFFFVYFEFLLVTSLQQPTRATLQPLANTKNEFGAFISSQCTLRIKRMAAIF
jgi:hypothetical protein